MTASYTCHFLNSLWIFKELHGLDHFALAVMVKGVNRYFDDSVAPDSWRLSLDVLTILEKASLSGGDIHLWDSQSILLKRLRSNLSSTGSVESDAGKTQLCSCQIYRLIHADGNDYEMHPLNWVHVYQSTRKQLTNRVASKHLCKGPLQKWSKSQSTVELESLAGFNWAPRP